MAEEFSSLAAIIRHSCRVHAALPALITPEGSGGHRTITYAELWPLIREWAGALTLLGLQKGSMVCIFSENRLEWTLTDLACQTLGITAVPIYPTLPADQAQYIVTDCGAKTVFCENAALAKRLEKLDNIDIITFESGDKCIHSYIGKENSLTNESWNGTIDGIAPDDICTIIYTSGTTGVPKGAILTNRNFIWMNKAVSSRFKIGPGDVFLGFLPLSHVFARANDHFLPLALGATAARAKSLASLGSDMVKLQPTLMLVVPRFLESVKDRICDGAAKQSGLKKRLFDWCLSQGTRKALDKFAPFASILDSIVAKKVRARTGGRLRFFIAGGAALPRSVYEFYAAFGLKVLQGYGLTETTSGIYLNDPQHEIRPDTVGEPLDGVETKIADDGEILVRGDSIMKGYWNLEEETKHAIDPEGWFHTGDIGEIDRGYLRITDRKKDLIVLGNGKNVAPQRLENELKASPFIAEAVVFGDGMEGCVALIVPAFDAVRAKLSLTESDAEVAVNDQVKKLVKGEIDAFNRSAASFEAIKRHALLPQGFSIESGELTPTLKVKRRVVKEKYADVLAKLAR